MNNLVKFGIALALAAVAGGLNCVYVQSQVATDSYVRVAKEVPAGRAVEESDLTTIAFPQRVGKLDATLIPWDRRHTVVGVAAPRTFAVGDLVLQQDLPPAPLIGRYEALGPFELIAVESQYSARTEGGDRLATGNRTEKITIAVPEDLDPTTRKLLDLLVAGRPATDKKALHVAGLLIVGSPGTTAIETPAAPPAPADGDAAAAPDAATDAAPAPVRLKKGFASLTINIRDVESVPKLLFDGGWVKFLLQAPGHDLDQVDRPAILGGADLKAAGTATSVATTPSAPTATTPTAQATPPAAASSTPTTPAPTTPAPATPSTPVAAPSPVKPPSGGSLFGP